MSGGASSPEASKPQDWRAVFLYLSERYGWTPDEIANMSLQQIWEYVVGAKTGSDEQDFDSASEKRIHDYHDGQGVRRTADEFEELLAKVRTERVMNRGR